MPPNTNTGIFQFRRIGQIACEYILYSLHSWTSYSENASLEEPCSEDYPPVLPVTICNRWKSLQLATLGVNTRIVVTTHRTKTRLTGDRGMRIIY